MPVSWTCLRTNNKHQLPRTRQHSSWWSDILEAVFLREQGFSRIIKCWWINVLLNGITNCTNDQMTVNLVSELQTATARTYSRSNLTQQGSACLHIFYQFIFQSVFSSSASVPLSVSVCLFSLLSPCRFISLAVGCLRSPSCLFWVSSQKITRHGSQGPLCPNKKENDKPLSCNASMLLLFLAIGGINEGGKGDSLSGTAMLVRWKDELTERRSVCPFTCVSSCPRAALTQFLYFMYFHPHPRSVLHHKEQDDITD